MKTEEQLFLYVKEYFKVPPPPTSGEPWQDFYNKISNPLALLKAHGEQLAKEINERHAGNAYNMIQWALIDQLMMGIYKLGYSELGREFNALFIRANKQRFVQNQAEWIKNKPTVEEWNRIEKENRDKLISGEMVIIRTPYPNVNQETAVIQIEEWVEEAAKLAEKADVVLADFEETIMYNFRRMTGRETAKEFPQPTWDIVYKVVQAIHDRLNAVEVCFSLATHGDSYSIDRDNAASFYRMVYGRTQSAHLPKEIEEKFHGRRD